MKYSIVAIPPKSIYSHLGKVIEELAQKYKGPIFEPHLTLLGNIDRNLNIIQDGIEKLTTANRPLELSLDCLSFSTTYFQSVFIRVKSTAQLMQYNLDLKNILNLENTVFMPHISLLYGNHDMQIREQAVSEIKIQPATFFINELVILTGTNPSEWKTIKTIPFKGKR